MVFAETLAVVDLLALEKVTFWRQCVTCYWSKGNLQLEAFDIGGKL